VKKSKGGLWNFVVGTGDSVLRGGGGQGGEVEKWKKGLNNGEDIL